MTASPQALPPQQSLDYFFGRDDRGLRQRRFRTIGLCSLIVSLVCIVCYLILLVMCLIMLADVDRNLKVGDSGAGFAAMILYIASWAIGLLLLVPILLLIAALFTLRARTAGVVLHWVYIPLQLVCGNFLAWTFLNEAPRGAFYFCGLVFSSVVCSYSILLVPLLRRTKRA